MPKDMVPEDYLNKDFDYTKLTKTQLRKIMYENGVEAIPPLTAKKSELIDAYKENIYKRIDVLMSRRKNISMENSFQNVSPKKKYVFEEVPDIPVTNSKGEDPYKKPYSEASMSDIGTPRKDVKEIKESTSRNFSPKSSSFVEKAPSNQEKRNSFVEDEAPGGSSLVAGMSAANNSTIGFSGSSFSSSFIHSSSSGRSSISRRNEKQGSSSDVRKRAFTSDPTLDKPELQSEHSSPRSSSNFTEINATRFRSRSKKNKWFLVLSIIGFAVAGYFRFMCPYCLDGRRFCIPLPEHSKINNGRLACDKGFIIKHGILRDYCIEDNRHEKEMSKKIKELKKILERRSGDYMYGMIPTKSVPVKLLSSDPEIIERLKKEVGIVISNEMIYSVNARVSMKTFFRYYFRRMIMISTPLAIIIIMIKIIGMFRKKKKERLQAAQKIVKDIADVLVRQIYVSTRNANFPSHVYIEQLKDCFGVDRKVWREAEKMIRRNSNIRESCIEGKSAWEWVGPILYKPEFNGSLF
ncbi:hypothetical protein EROM_111680 [Encephalitozoon romaleae SJ-2008]|uniref:Man1/Src1-like C-terminal domain-containing protein n=1 Tax=Encephalitozoon romaleae (strain SJ-2008) TaxID=1178016 RepID=I7AQM0_ENCRO|nr:hypothetical protein EROM_111680 [Encephalitozoon romaleae SJ-2008]AFN84149.1 hypothetical protein EROM_111680 [Encephalitozoon romaleae SJ-2008]